MTLRLKIWVSHGPGSDLGSLDPLQGVVSHSQPGALPHSSLALAVPSLPLPLSKAATSLYSLPTRAFSAAVGSKGVLSSEPVSELGEYLEFRWLRFAREKRETQMGGDLSEVPA